MTDQDPDTIKTDEYDIFISYSHRDENDTECASKLAGWLKERGYTVWWDRELLVGEDWDAKITGKMKGARRVVALISRRALDSENCVITHPSASA